MKTKKLNLNELRGLVKKIIQEESLSDEWKDIDKMAERFLKAKNPDFEKLKSLDEMDFVVLIYSLYTGKYEITGINNKGFLRYFMTSGTSEEKNIPLRIVNNLPYTKEDFIRVINSSMDKSVNENFEIHFSDGIRAKKKAKSLNDAIRIANELKSKDNMQFVDIYKADSGFHSTADEKRLVKWWGKNSYWDNKSKKDSSLLKKRL